jgi:hypothetical protein
MIMKMTDILEKDRENLITEITGAGTADKAVRVLENEVDKLLIRYNETLLWQITINHYWNGLTNKCIVIKNLISLCQRTR